MTTSEEKPHRVAVTLFMEVSAVDQLDADDSATWLVRRYLPRDLSAEWHDHLVEGRVQDVKELGQALLNGQLNITPTTKEDQ